MTSSTKKSKQTPNYDHVLDDKVLRTNVYEPEADSFLFLDALDAEICAIGAKVLSQIQKRSPLSSSSSLPASSSSVVVFRSIEVGPGSGIVITHLGMILRSYLLELSSNSCGNTNTTTRRDDDDDGSKREEGGGEEVVVVEFHAIDMNPLAVKAAKETWRRNIVDVQPSQPSSTGWPDTPIASVTVVSPPVEGKPTSTRTVSIVFRACFSTGNLFEGDGSDEVSVPPRTLNSRSSTSSFYDLVLFNPPYVPTDEAELQDALDKKDLITAAWCGGPRGRVVVDRFFHDINRWWFPSMCNNHVMCFVVAIRQNEPIDMAQYFKREVFEAIGIREGEESWVGSNKQQPTLEVVEVPVGVNGSVVEGPLVGCTRASPPLPLMVATGTTTTTTFEFKAKAVAARYTGEHLSILKFDVIRH